MKVGNTSFGIVLPKPWIRYYGLEAGDSVEVTSDSVIQVRPLGDKRGNPDGKQ